LAAIGAAGNPRRAGEVVVWGSARLPVLLLGKWMAWAVLQACLLGISLFWSYKGRDGPTEIFQ